MAKTPVGQVAEVHPVDPSSSVVVVLLVLQVLQVPHVAATCLDSSGPEAVEYLPSLVRSHSPLGSVFPTPTVVGNDPW